MRIKQEIIDRINKDGSPCGTEVRILVPDKFLILSVSYSVHQQYFIP